MAAWLVCGCGAAHSHSQPPPLTPTVTPIAAPAPAAAGPPPALAPVPTGVPRVVMTLDFGRLLSSLDQGTSSTLQPTDLAAIWPAAGVRLDRPMVVGAGYSLVPGPVSITSVRDGTSYRWAAPDPELSGLGLRPIEGGFCALETRADQPRLFCGNRGELLAYGASLGERHGELPEAAVLHLELKAQTPALDETIYGLRNAVPRQVELLLPPASPLGNAVALQLALSDAGFEAASRVAQLYAELGRVGLTLNGEVSGRFALHAELPFAPGSQLDKLLGDAPPLHVPQGFWELPIATEQALLFDSSSLSRLLAPSARQVALLTEARSSSSTLVDDFAATATSCWGTSRALVRAQSGKQTFWGLEDGSGSCAKQLGALFAELTRASQSAGQPEAKQTWVALEPDKKLPKSVKLWRVGFGDNLEHWALFSKSGMLWLVTAPDAAALQSSALEMLLPTPRRRTLRDRAELSGLTSAGGVLSGFVTEESVPGASLTGVPAAASSKTKPADGDGKRVAFTLTRSGSKLAFEASLSGSWLRRRFAEIFGAVAAQMELDKLSEPKKSQIVALLEGSCRLGYPDACNLLGVAFAEGRGVVKDLERGLAMLELGCNSGSGMACANWPFYSKPSPTEERQLFSKSCDLGTPLGCAWLGARLQEGGQAKDLSAAFDKLRVGCEGRVGWACARLGFAHADGSGLEKDAKQAADYHARACSLSVGISCVELGHAYAHGDGRTQDQASAFKIFERACALDHAAGCFALAVAYRNGIGTAKNEARAKEQLNVACDAKYAEACRYLAEMAGEP